MTQTEQFELDIHEPRFRDEIHGAASIDPAVLRMWRARYGLLRKGYGEKFSLVDVFVARLAVMLVGHGYSHQDAVGFADNKLVRSDFEILLSDPRSWPPIRAFSFDANGRAHTAHADPDKDRVADMLARTHGGLCVVIDLRVVIAHVADALGLTLGGPST